MRIPASSSSPREGEIEGRDYCFIDRRRFDEMIAKGELLEHATVFGNCYGTPRRPIEEALAAGRDVVGDLDWQGAQQLTESVPHDLVSVFVLPPSLAALETPLGTSFQLVDLGSKNGTFLRIHEEAPLQHGDYVFIGQQLLRVEVT